MQVMGNLLRIRWDSIHGGTQAERELMQLDGTRMQLDEYD